LAHCYAYAKKVYVDRAFQKKTNELVQKHIGTTELKQVNEFVEINAETIELIEKQSGGDNTRVINLVKSIQKAAEDESGDPFLIALSDRAKSVQESFEDRQLSTADALAELIKAVEKNEQRRQEQAAKGLDSLNYYLLTTFTDAGLPNPETVSSKVAQAFSKHPNWRRSESELRELRKAVTFAVFAEEDDMEKVAAIVESLFGLLQREDMA